MNFFRTACATALTLAAGAAHADPIDLSTLNYNGSASSVGTTANLTQVNPNPTTGNTNEFTGGAVYSGNALSNPTNFSTTFSFNIGAQSNGLAGNGFAFVLSTTPQQEGTSNKNLGLGNPTTVPVSLDIQFNTFGRPTNPLDGSGNPYSNLVAVNTDGNLTVPQSATASYGAPYNVTECNNLAATKSSASGCMSNGSIWTATITYAKGLLSVTLTDPNETVSSTVISGYAIDLGALFGTNAVYAGFSASNGAVTESTTIDSWSFASQPVPEPGSLAIFGVALAGLGYTVRRRRAG